MEAKFDFSNAFLKTFFPLFFNTGNYVQSLELEHNARSYEKKKEYMTGSLCFTAEIEGTFS